MTGVDISRASADERAAVFGLLEAAGLPREGLDAHFASTLVARKDGRIVGSVALELYPNGALLRSVAVADSLRGHGLGRQLTQAAIDLAASAKAPAIYLLTTTAEHFFPKFGFARITREEVPADVQGSVEFASACPASAAVLRKVIA